MEQNINNEGLKAEHYAAIYTRKSTKDDNGSPVTQRRKGKASINNNNLILYKIYEDSISATKFKFNERPGFKQLLSDAKKGYFRTVVVLKRDRLARNMDDFMSIRRELKKYGIKIIYSDEGEFQGNESYISDFIENIIMAVAEIEPKQICQRTIDGINDKRRRGEYDTKNIPFGYDRRKSNKEKPRLNEAGHKVNEYFPKEGEKELIELIFKKYNEIIGKCNGTDFANEINNENNYAKTITSSKIASYIKNPIYGGLQLIDNESKEAAILSNSDNKLEIDKTKYHSCTNVIPIISADIWFQAMNKWVNSYEKRKYTKHDFLFKGILYCGECGEKLSVQNEYIRCSKKQCFSSKLSKVVDTIINFLINDLLLNENSLLKNTGYLTDIKNQQRKLAKELKELEHKQNHILEQLILEPGNIESIEELAEINKCITSLEVRKDSVNDSIESLSNIIEFIRKSFNSNDKAHLVKYISDNQNKFYPIIKENIEKVYIIGAKKNISIKDIKCKCF